MAGKKRRGNPARKLLRAKSFVAGQKRKADRIAAALERHKANEAAGMTVWEVAKEKRAARRYLQFKAGK